ncbi:VOC family protein [Sciscionella sediminilitoris]|uniref:VOC family protein n=1 Tax=Sciscionella sediminilitoris TaxID=1445613 RepID=UPI0004DFA458|nr:VOC family protein [Sciscionella sp. SE31]
MNRLGLITLVVPGYDEAIDFYVRVLGFELLEDTRITEHKRWVVVRPRGASETGLLLARAASGRQRTSIGEQTGGRVGFFLYTTDFPGEYRRLRAAGVRFEEQPRHEPYGTVAVFTDPYGNRWDLLEPIESR